MGGEEADAIADAVIKNTPNALVEVLPGQLNISAPGRLEFECSDVSDGTRTRWDTRELRSSSQTTPATSSAWMSPE